MEQGRGSLYFRCYRKANLGAPDTIFSITAHPYKSQKPLKNQKQEGSQAITAKIDPLRAS